METRICTKCGSEFPATSEYFDKDKNAKNGLYPSCKICKKNYRQENKENLKINSKEYCAKNKDRLKEYGEKYRQENREFIKERQKILYQGYKEQKKKYQEEHKEQRKKYGKEYRQTNKEKLREAKKEYIKNNLENTMFHQKERSKKYYWTHKKQESERGKTYRKNNPDKMNVIKQRRIARKKKLPASYTTRQWTLTMQYFNNKCAYCGEESKLFQEHFIALSKGGEYTHNNIVPACVSCNSSKRDKDFFSWYPKQSFYSKAREKKILKYLHYTGGTQQLSISI